jgi:hypothetical protein
MKSILIAALLFSSIFVHAAVPSLINYQGLLTDINGNVVSSTKTVSVSIHDAATNGTQLYTESIGSVTVQNGIYSFQFGSGPTFTTTLATGSQHWLQVTLDGIAQTPRERLVSVPFAMKAVEADIAGFNAAAEARVRSLEDNFLLSRLDDFAYRGLSKPGTPTTSVWESFPTAVGANSRVTTATSGSFIDSQYNTLAFTVVDLPAVNVTGPVNGLKLFNTLTVNAKTQRAEAEFYVPFSGGVPGRFIFRYSDSTSANVDISVTADFQYQNKVAINPSLSKTVTSVEIYLTNQITTNAFVRNAKVATVSSATITLSLATQSTNWTSFRIAALGAREPGDSITFSITDGSTTLSNLALDTVHMWSGAAAPTSVTITLSPSLSGTAKGTSLTTLGAFYTF